MPWGFCPHGQSGRGTKLTTHCHLIPRLITSAAIRLNPLFAFRAKHGQIYVSELLRFPLWTSRCICIYLTVVITQPQQNCLLCSIKHGYVFRPHRGHLQAIKSYQIKFPFAIPFLCGWIEIITWWRSWLRYSATSRKAAVSIPDVVIGIFNELILPAALWSWDRLKL